MKVAAVYTTLLPVKSSISMALWLILTTHVVVDLALVVLPLDLKGSGLLMVAVGLLQAQVSLVALWAVRRAAKFYLRFAAAVSGTAALWLVFMHTLPFSSLHGLQSATWAIGLAIQSLLVMVLAVTGRIVWKRFLTPQGTDRNTRTPQLQYSILSLMVFTAIIACVLGLLRRIAEPLGWSFLVLEWEFFGLVQVMAFYNALYALLAIASLAPGRKRVVVVAAMLLAGASLAIAASQPSVLDALFGKSGGLDRPDSLILCAAQVAVLYSTLLGLRICGEFEPNRPINEIPSVSR